MTKEQLFKKYSINESHNVWQNEVDNWMSVEVYRIMHDGKLPDPDDTDVNYVTEFLDKTFLQKFLQKKNSIIIIESH